MLCKFVFLVSMIFIFHLVVGHILIFILISDQKTMNWFPAENKHAVIGLFFRFIFKESFWMICFYFFNPSATWKTLYSRCRHAKYLNILEQWRNGVFDVVFCRVALSDSCQRCPVEFSATRWRSTPSSVAHYLLFILQINYFLNKGRVSRNKRKCPVIPYAHCLSCFMTQCSWCIPF